METESRNDSPTAGWFEWNDSTPSFARNGPAPRTPPSTPPLSPLPDLPTTLTLNGRPWFSVEATPVRNWTQSNATTCSMAYGADPFASSPPPSPAWFSERVRSPTPALTPRSFSREEDPSTPPAPQGQLASTEPLNLSNRGRKIHLIAEEDGPGRSRDISPLLLSLAPTDAVAQRDSVIFDTLARRVLDSSAYGESSSDLFHSPVTIEDEDFRSCFSGQADDYPEDGYNSSEQGSSTAANTPSTLWTVDGTPDTMASSVQADKVKEETTVDRHGWPIFSSLDRSSV